MTPGWGKAIMFLFELQQNYRLAWTFSISKLFHKFLVNYSTPASYCWLKSAKCTQHDSTMVGYPWHRRHHSTMPMTSSYSALILPNGIRENWIRRCPTNKWTIEQFMQKTFQQAYCLSTSFGSQSKLKVLWYWDLCKDSPTLRLSWFPFNWRPSWVLTAYCCNCPLCPPWMVNA